MHRASFLRQAQDQALAEQTPLRQLAVEEGTSQTTSMAEQNLPERQALQGRTSQKRHKEHPPPQQEQLDLAQLEHMMLKIEMLQKVVRKLARGRLPSTLAAELAADDCKQHSEKLIKRETERTTEGHEKDRDREIERESKTLDKKREREGSRA